MKQWLIVVPLTLLLSSCDEEVDPKEAAIQREVAKRVEIVRAEMKTDEDRRQTIRVVVYSLVIGGVLVCVIRWQPSRGTIRQQPQSPQIANQTRQSHPPGSRIIEPPNGPRRPFGD